MSEHDTQPIVTEEHLNLSMIAPAARKLTLAVKLPGAASRVDVEYLVRGRLDTDRMIEALQLETTINEALAGDQEPATLIAALDQGNRYVREILLELNDEATVPEKLHLDEQQTLMTLAWISGDVTVADAIARVITGGIEKALSPEELDAAGDESDASRVGSAAPLP